MGISTHTVHKSGISSRTLRNLYLHCTWVQGLVAMYILLSMQVQEYVHIYIVHKFRYKYSYCTQVKLLHGTQSQELVSKQYTISVLSIYIAHKFANKYQHCAQLQGLIPTLYTIWRLIFYTEYKYREYNISIVSRSGICFSSVLQFSDQFWQLTQMWLLLATLWIITRVFHYK
jgi:hypothetical protein